MVVTENIPSVFIQSTYNVVDIPRQPFREAKQAEFQVILNTREYWFTFTLNVEHGYYKLTIRDDGNQILDTLRVVPNEEFVIPGFDNTAAQGQDGLISIREKEIQDEDITQENIGKNHELHIRTGIDMGTAKMTDTALIRE